MGWTSVHEAYDRVIAILKKHVPNHKARVAIHKELMVAFYDCDQYKYVCLEDENFARFFMCRGDKAFKEAFMELTKDQDCYEDDEE